jgi:hypothetical protein
VLEGETVVDGAGLAITVQTDETVERVAGGEFPEPPPGSVAQQATDPGVH